MSISTLKWPLFATIAPSFIFSKCACARTLVLPVTVQKKSPIFAASRPLMTRNPSMVASRALSGSISVTTASATMPFARMARPRPHHP